MAENAPFLPGLSPVGGKPVHLTFDGGRLTSDAGVLLLAEVERRLGLAQRLARCLADPRAPERIRHTLAEMIRFRMLLIAAGYPDANDCDSIRVDPAFKMAVGRLPEGGEDLCSQPTMCRLENLPGPIALKRMMAAPRRSPDRRSFGDRIGRPPGGRWSRCSATASRKCRAGSCWTSTTPATRRTASSSWHSSTPITMSAASCRSMSTKL